MTLYFADLSESKEFHYLSIETTESLKNYP